LIHCMFIPAGRMGPYALNRNAIFSAVVLFIFSGCASPFLEKEFVVNLDYSSDNLSRVVFYESTIDFRNMDDVRETTRSIVKIGSTAKNFPDVLNVTDNSIYRLISYNARILDAHSVKKTFSRKNLHQYNLSSSGEISSSSVYFLPVSDIVRPGDLIETISEHRYSLPQLGVNFSEPGSMDRDREYTFRVIVPEGYEIKYMLTNGFPAPLKEVMEDKSELYIFKGVQKKHEIGLNVFAKRRNDPGILITCAAKKADTYSWNSFGSWYYNLFKAKTQGGKNLQETTSKITSGLTTDIQKLEAIFNYCRQKVRYEQVYLDKGEFIPNDCNLVLERGYGDCKDYSVLIFTMAEIAGIKTAPALCFRGRGVDEFQDIPVSRFNHVIIHYRSSDNKEYWLDGTNRSGIFGLTTSDLINQTALITGKDSSFLLQISNSESNLVKVTGSITKSNTDLSGELIIQVTGQYASDFFYYDYVLNKKDMLDLIHKSMKRFISSKIIIRDITIEKNPDIFTIRSNCTLPNSIMKIDSFYYTSAQQVLPSVTDKLPPDYRTEDIFYYPHYANMEIDVEIRELTSAETSEENNFRIMHKWSLDPGYYNTESRTEFFRNLKNTQESLLKKYKLKDKSL
jgi:hypothetical protein